jgi:uncharacterized membrane protein
MSTALPFCPKTARHPHLVDTVPPEVLVTVEPGNTVTRTVTVVASDASTEVAAVRLSNDPRMLEGVVTLTGMG